MSGRKQLPNNVKSQRRAIQSIQQAIDLTPLETDVSALEAADIALDTRIDALELAPPTHVHAAADITTGTIATARLGSGTANSTTFLRGDQTWVAVGGGGGGDLLAANNLSDVANVATARTNLGLAIGTNVQAFDAGLLSIAGLTTLADRMIYTTASDVYAVTTLTSFGRSILDDADAATARTTLGLANLATTTASAYALTLLDDVDAATARTTLGLVIGTNVQAQDAELAAIAGLTSAADRLPYFTGSGTAALATFTTFGRSIVDDADATACRTTLGLTNLATTTGSAYILTLLDDADAATARTTLGLGTAATQNTGTSGSTVPLLSSANTWSSLQQFNQATVSTDGIRLTNTADGRRLHLYANKVGSQNGILYLDAQDGHNVEIQTSGVTRVTVTAAGDVTATGALFTQSGKKVMRATSGTATNSGLISWGTAAPGALAEGEMYLRHA